MMNNSNIGSECVFYSTTIDKCDCGETILYNSMYRCDIPCSHRLFFGAQFPHIKDIELILNKQFDELIPDLQEDNKSIEQIESNKLKELISRNIKKFSKYKDVDKINQFIEQNFIPKYDEFALGYPIEFFEVISKGIKCFTSKK